MKKKLQNIGAYMYRGLDYALWFSTTAGMTNALIEQSRGNDLKEAFGRGFINHFELSAFVSLLYPAAIDWLKKTKHPRLYVNLAQAAMFSSFATWHYFEGTQNPFLSMIPLVIIGGIKINSEDLEVRVK